VFCCVINVSHYAYRYRLSGVSDGVLVWSSVWSKVQIVCIWSSCQPKTPSSLATFKSRLVLPFWYRLTQVVLEKRPLNGCSSSHVSGNQFVLAKLKTASKLV